MLGKWKASDMRFVQVWNCDQYKPEEKNYTEYSLIYSTPNDDSVHLTVNVEEGKVFLDEGSRSATYFENEKERNLFVQMGQNKFDREIDMGTDRSNFIYGYGGTMACLTEYKNSNIEYIPLIFPDNEKFQNPRYREKVEWSLIHEGAIFIKPKDGEKYLAVIQRKHKPRSLTAFSRYIVTDALASVEKVKQDFVTITVPKWLADRNGTPTFISKAIIEKETEKAVFVKYAGKTACLPKSQITIN